ncbi:MAG: SDR family oxidoreductase [Leptospirales bacterium]|jgi:3-oxoacyl-[acyl-carrier protein] reductase
MLARKAKKKPTSGGGEAEAAAGQTRTTPFDVDGKAILITGASRGIGRAIALGMRDAGAIIYGTGTKPESVDWMAGQGLVGRPIDVRDEAGTDAFIGEIVKKHGKLDCLINNAGITDGRLASWHDAESVEDVMSTNYKGTMIGSLAYFRHHRKLGGIIINVSSILGIVGTEMSSVYCSSKGAINQLTRCLAMEWAPYKFRVNALCPGLVDTDFIKPITDHPVVLKAAIERTPMKRIAQPEEMVGAAIFLASEASSFMTGQTLVLDGGTTVH